jgi:hypothetical protein
VKKIPLIGCSLIFLLLAYWKGLPEMHPAAFLGPLRMGDLIDQEAIVNGLLRTQSYGEAMAWWTGPWVGYLGSGQENSFYRPLTSLVWYAQYRLWGENGALQFMVMHRLWHLVVCLLAVAFSDALSAFASLFWVWPSGLWPSGLWPSGLWPSGLWPSGLWPSGLWPSGLWPSRSA